MEILFLFFITALVIPAQAGTASPYRLATSKHFSSPRKRGPLLLTAWQHQSTFHPRASGDRFTLPLGNIKAFAITASLQTVTNYPPWRLIFITRKFNQDENQPNP